MSKQIITILLFILYLHLSQARSILVPSVSIQDILYLRTQQIITMDSAFDRFGSLNKIYKKEIYQIKDGKEVDFPLCKEEAPESVFASHSYHYIEDNKIKNRLVYNFEDIKQPRNLIDMALHEQQLLYVLSQGTLKIANISPDLRKIRAQTSFNISNQKLSSGYLVILPDARYNYETGYAVYVHQTFAVLVNLTSKEATFINQYEKKLKVQSLVALEGNKFAVAYGKQGMRIFQINFEEQTLKVIYQYSQKDAMDIRDIAYHRQRRILFVLDYNTGLIPMQLSFANSTLQVSSTSFIKRLNYCNLLHYDQYNEDLYINCRKLYKFRIHRWPENEQIALPKLQISIRQIISTSKLTAFVGRNIFEIIYSQRKSAIYQDQLLDKFIITQNMFVSGNQNGILVGNYTLKPPSLVCSSYNVTELGSHRILMKVTAQCNEEYFKQAGFTTSSTSSQDKCIYSVYQNLSVWAPAHLNTDSYFLIAIVIGIIGFAVLIWWGFSYLNLRKLQLYFQNYRNLEQQKGSERQPGNKSIDLENKQKDISGGTGQVLKQKEDPLQMQNDNIHDIE